MCDRQSAAGLEGTNSVSAVVPAGAGLPTATPNWLSKRRIDVRAFPHLGVSCSQSAFTGTLRSSDVRRTVPATPRYWPAVDSDPPPESRDIS